MGSQPNITASHPAPGARGVSPTANTRSCAPSHRLILHRKRNRPSKPPTQNQNVLLANGASRAVSSQSSYADQSAPAPLTPQHWTCLHGGGPTEGNLSSRYSPARVFA